MMCLACGHEGPPGTSRDCRNCGATLGLPEVPPESATPELPVAAEPDAAEAAFRGLLALAGEDPDRPELAETPRRAVQALLSLTAGYDQDPTAILVPLEAETAAPGGPRCTLSQSAPLRMACERCLLPILGRVTLRCIPGRPLTGEQLARLTGALSGRLQSEGQLAEQLVGALVQLGGAEHASAKIVAWRPCDDCGKGQVKTTARASAWLRVERTGGNLP